MFNINCRAFDASSPTTFASLVLDLGLPSLVDRAPTLVRDGWKEWWKRVVGFVLETVGSFKVTEKDLALLGGGTASFDVAGVVRGLGALLPQAKKEQDAMSAVLATLRWALELVRRALHAHCCQKWPCSSAC